MRHLLRHQRHHRSESVSMRYRRRGGIAEAEHAGHIVVLDPAATRYYGFDQVGARIWTLLNDSVTTEHIVERLVDEYDAPLEQVRADVQHFLDKLAHAGLIGVERRA